MSENLLKNPLQSLELLKSLQSLQDTTEAYQGEHDLSDGFIKQLPDLGPDLGVQEEGLKIASQVKDDIKEEKAAAEEFEKKLSEQPAEVSPEIIAEISPEIGSEIGIMEGLAPEKNNENAKNDENESEMFQASQGEFDLQDTVTQVSKEESKVDEPNLQSEETEQPAVIFDSFKQYDFFGGKTEEEALREYEIIKEMFEQVLKEVFREVLKEVLEEIFEPLQNNVVLEDLIRDIVNEDSFIPSTEEEFAITDEATEEILPVLPFTMDKSIDEEVYIDEVEEMVYNENSKSELVSEDRSQRESAEQTTGSLTQEDLKSFCEMSQVPECQQFTDYCKDGAMLDCVALMVPCTIAAVEIGPFNLNELINSDVKCYTDFI